MSHTDKPPRKLGKRSADALLHIAELHGDQDRKGGEGIPYLGHLLGVAGIIIAHGGDEDESIAALLHDAAEDKGGELELARISGCFGDRVAGIVRGCSDSLTTDPIEKAPWRSRKEAYIEHLRSCGEASVHFVSAADKLDNARATYGDFMCLANEVWKRFNKDAGREGTLWYYDALLDAYAKGPPDSRRDPIVRELRQIIDRLTRESRSP